MWKYDIKSFVDLPWIISVYLVGKECIQKCIPITCFPYLIRDLCSQALSLSFVWQNCLAYRESIRGIGFLAWITLRSKWLSISAYSILETGKCSCSQCRTSTQISLRKEYDATLISVNSLGTSYISVRTRFGIRCMLFVAPFSHVVRQKGRPSYQRQDQGRSRTQSRLKRILGSLISGNRESSAAHSFPIGQ